MRRCSGFAIGVSPSNGRPDACASRCRTVEPGGPAGASRSTTPSSAATRTASAVASFVTDAHPSATSRGPCVATTSPGRTTPADACSAPQSSTCRSASTRRYYERVERQLISSGSSWEERYGYSRAVVAGDRVHVSGTAPVMPGDADPPSDPYGQARRCLEILVQALAEADASPNDVVRTRIFVTDRTYMDEVMRAHAEVFAHARPACTGIVTELIDPRWLVEIEAEAILPS